jgi:hypothetical protein
MHMTFKYLLELLRSGLAEEFYRDLNTMLPPFMDPEVYGRSILENSSFIASSANPDPEVHGAGFVARLSGSTAEFIHILHLMAFGPAPFRRDGKGRLELRFEPVLADWLFSRRPCVRTRWVKGVEEGLRFPARSFSAAFLGETMVTDRNPGRAPTSGPKAVAPQRMTLSGQDGTQTTVDAGFLEEPLARAVRERRFPRIDVELG